MLIFSLNPIVSFLTISSTFDSLFKVLFIFPHGTFLLSVSRLYLALDEVYHLIRAAIPNNPTLKSANIKNQSLGYRTGLSPSLIPLSKGFAPMTDLEMAHLEATIQQKMTPR